jgi:putative membrane protein
MWHYGWGFFGIGSILTILFWIVVIGLVFALFAKHRHEDDYEDSTKALDILKERYAKGEIDKKKFEEMKKDIS